MRGCILEGVTACGKSTIFRRIQQKLVQEHPAQTKLLYSEHYTERVLEHLREASELTEFAVVGHLKELLQPLKMLSGKKARSKFAGRSGNASVIAVFERFLLGHVANMRTQDQRRWAGSGQEDAFVADLYGAAGDCGLARIVLRCDDDGLTRRILSTRKYRNAAWLAHLQTIGGDDRVVEHYRTWQSHLLEFADRHHAQIKPIYVVIPSDAGPERLEGIGDEIYNNYIREHGV
jgi:hypothetical protein